MIYKACIFDLDGVIVDTAYYHYLSWVTLCKTFGFNFKQVDNEQLKGVNRVQSLEIILKMADEKKTAGEKASMRDLKNKWYLEYIDQMTKDDILPGVIPFITEIRNLNIKIALGSASKNAAQILKKIDLSHLFDAIIDGNHIKKGKPDPEVFTLAAKELNMDPAACIVFEDAYKGVQAAKTAGMKTVGVGDPSILDNPDMVISGFENLTWHALIIALNGQS